MRDLGDVIADLQADEGAGDGHGDEDGQGDGDGKGDEGDDAHLYSTLAPVYDFAYERHFDYDDQFALVTETAPENAESVLELGCGTGRLLARLEDEYATAVGLERSVAMARRARDRVDEAKLVVGDATRTRLDPTFDAVVALGRVTGHVTEHGAAERLVENCLGTLRPGGVLLFDYFPTERMEDDHRTTDSFEGERYRVEREAHSTIPDRDGGPDLVETEFDYEIFDRETGESATTAETMTLRMFSHREVRDLLREAGSSEVEVREEGADGWPLAVARKPGRGD